MISRSPSRYLTFTKLSSCEDWWAAVDSNHLPPRYQHGALPVELAAQTQTQDPRPDTGHGV
jgi:hypothetical protein